MVKAVKAFRTADSLTKEMHSVISNPAIPFLYSSSGHQLTPTEL